MNSYLELLDLGALFEILVRTHYQDLVNICMVYNELYKITCTPHFQECWKKHNITKVETETSIKHLDRSGKLHGKFIVKNVKGIIQEESDCIQGQLHGKNIIYIDGIKRKEKTYVNNVEHGTTICYFGDYEANHSDSAWTNYQGFANGHKHGLSRTYDLHGAHQFVQYNNGFLQGKSFTWWPNGSLKTITTYIRGNRNFRLIDIDDKGRKLREFGMINNKYEGAYKTWNVETGKLRGHCVYLNGIVIQNNLK